MNYWQEGRSARSAAPPEADFLGKHFAIRRSADALSPVSVYNSFPATGHREFLLPAQSPISVAVVGVGVFGRNHARVYKELEQQGEAVRLLGGLPPAINLPHTLAPPLAYKRFHSLDH